MAIFFFLQARHEKEVIRQNRIFREKQYQDRRLKDFEDALDLENVSPAVISDFSQIWHFLKKRPTII